MIRIHPGEPREAATGYVRHTAHFESSAQLEDLWFMTSADVLPPSDDWLVPVGAVIGMALGEDVHIEGRVSAQLLARLEAIQRISVERQAGFQRISLSAKEVAPTPRAGSGRVLSCFSAGVDSFYPMLDPAEGIDDLLYVHGFEALVHEQRLLMVLLPHLRAAAAELGKTLRLVETNWRMVAEPLFGHTYFSSMPMLFAIGHLMGSTTRRLVVPETRDFHYAPEDPLSVPTYLGHWSSEGVQVVERGNLPRLDKMARLVESEVAMRHLRVCWARSSGVYNCGRCGKCIRTRVHLRFLGVEGRCQTLPPRVRPRDVRRAKPEDELNIGYIDENIEEAECLGLPEFAAALRVQRAQPVTKPTWREPRRKLSREIRSLRRSRHKRRIDARLDVLRRRCGDAHLFNCLGETSENDDI